MEDRDEALRSIRRQVADLLEQIDAIVEEKPKRPRERDLIWEALVEACGINPDDITESGRGAINKAVKEFRKIGASPEGIRARAKIYMERFPGTHMSPAALAKNYAQLGSRPGRTSYSRNDPSKCRDCGQPLDAHDQGYHDAVAV